MQTKMFYVYENDNPAVQEAYAMLLANLNLRVKEKSKTFVLTSSNPNEGKTSLAISLAISTARFGLKVLLVDADLRKPTSVKRMNQGSFLGLSDYLLGGVDLPGALSQTNITNLSYLSCGNHYPNPIALLSSTHFEILIRNLKSEYDLVLFDSPALSSVVDAGLIASKADGALLVVKMGSTSLLSLNRVKELLENLNANLIGVILNKVKKRDYKMYFRSYNYFFNPDRFYNNKKVKLANRGVYPSDFESIK